MAGESKKAVVAAVAGNAAIATIKFAAAAVTGSSSMLAEGIHSLVDTGNGCLLLLGLNKSQKPPDTRHPFGHGKEIYFWSLIVALIIFGIGGGMSIYEGITHLQHPAPLEDPTWNYVVLAAAAVFEGISFVIGYGQFRKLKGAAPVLRAIREGKDPSIFTIVIEDTVALVGLAIAFVAIFVGHLLDNPYIDGVGSIAIGTLLASIAFWLAAESKDLLLGEAVSPEMTRRIHEVADADPAVEETGPALTMYLGPRDVLLNIEIEFRHGLSASQIRASIDRIEERLRQRYPEITRVFIEVGSLRAGHEVEHVTDEAALRRGEEATGEPGQWT